MKTGYTQRGFSLIKFVDLYKVNCSIQQSSLAGMDAIWLGVDLPAETARKQVEANGTMLTRMHLTRQQAHDLAGVLLYFAENGELPEEHPSLDAVRE